MKFGDTLRERSIPQWAYHNIDYDDLKRMIKDHTAGAQSQPRFIPGHGNEAKAPREFEDALYAQLVEQHERIDRFVRSKAGELERILADLEQQAEKLKQRFCASDGKKLSMRRVERFSRLEDTALGTGQELEHLDRFVVVNRRGFYKILKKYKKWTNSIDLEHRFHKHVLDRPTSFTNHNFSPSLAHYNEVLANIRLAGSPSAPVQSSRIANSSKRSRQAGRSSSTIAADMKVIYEEGADVEIDTALAMLPFGRSSGIACYWVHLENLLQIQVLLLRHTRSRKNQISVSTPPPLSKRPSRRESTSGSVTAAATGSPDEKACVIICDNLPAFTKRRDCETVSDSEGAVGKRPETAAASIRLSSTDDAMVVVGASLGDKPESDDHSTYPSFTTMKVERKALRLLFDSEASLKNTAETEDLQSPAATDRLSLIRARLNTTSDVEEIKQWLDENKTVQPLVELHYQRCRFAGIRNSANSGFWATLDTDITMAKSTLLPTKKYGSSGPSNETDHIFPYAVLTVRFEGKCKELLIEELDISHLTERVRGFSLETHALAILYQPRNMPPPHWLPLLDQDIRKAPRSIEDCGQGNTNARSTPRSGSTQPTSISASSGNEYANGRLSPRIQSSETSVPDLPESSRASIVRKKRKMRRERLLNKAVYDPSSQQKQRYWNEFDDGDDVSDNEAYTIFIDPDAPSTFPGAATFSHLVNSLKRSSRKFKYWLWRERSTDDERKSLLSNERATSRSSNESSDIEDGMPGATHLRHEHRSYRTFLGRSFPPYANTQDTWLTGACIVSILLSYILLFMVIVLVATGRRKAAATTDVGVLVGVAFSLVLGVGAIASISYRRVRAGWIWWVITSVLFLIVIGGNGVLLVHVL